MLEYVAAAMLLFYVFCVVYIIVTSARERRGK